MITELKQLIELEITYRALEFELECQQNYLKELREYGWNEESYPIFCAYEDIKNTNLEIIKVKQEAEILYNEITK